jgi:hypothetical protein
VATALAAGGFATVGVPVSLHYRDAYQVLAYAHGSPCPYVVRGPGDARLTLFCTVVALLALVTAVALARPRPAVRE